MIDDLTRLRIRAILARLNGDKFSVPFHPTSPLRGQPVSRQERASVVAGMEVAAGIVGGIEGWEWRSSRGQEEIL